MSATMCTDTIVNKHCERADKNLVIFHSTRTDTVAQKFQARDEYSTMYTKRGKLTLFGDTSTRSKSSLSTNSTVGYWSSILSNSKDAEVRARAVRILGTKGNYSAVNSLISALNDSAFYVREAAAASLWQIKDNRGVPALCTVIYKNRPMSSNAEDAIATQLAKVKNAWAKTFLKRVVRTSNVVVFRVAAFKALGQSAYLLPLLAYLKKELVGKNHVRRSRAAEALGELGDERAVVDLVWALREDADYFVRSCAAWALGKIGDTWAVPALIKALQEDQYELVRWSAATALGELGDKRAVPELIRALQSDQDASVRRYSAEALVELGDRRAVLVLTNVLQREQDKWFRAYAAVALFRLGDKRAVPALIKALQRDRDAVVRSSVVEALHILGDKRAVPALIKALQEDQDWWVRSDAAEALGELGDKRAVAALTKASQEDKDDWVRSCAASALSKLS